MIRLNIVAEGQTEQRFIDRLIKPHLASMGVFVSCRCVRTSINHQTGRLHSGGISSFGKLKRDIMRWVREDERQDARFTTMLDRYGLPGDFPGIEAARNLADPYQAVQDLEESFRDEIADRRFVPYLQLHEFEAILLAGPEAFRRHFPNANIDALKGLVGRFDTPERIDDGEKTSPSKRIIDIIPEYAYLKAVAGPLIAEKIGLDQIRSKCPHFDRWLSKLESLGNS